MTEKSRLAALQLMQRICQHELEAIGSELSAIRSQQADLQRQSRDLTSTARQEAADCGPEARAFLPPYLAAVDRQQRRLERELDRLDQEAEEHEARLFQAFRKSKVNHSVMSRIEQDIALNENRADIAMTDDLNRPLYLANQARGVR